MTANPFSIYRLVFLVGFCILGTAAALAQPAYPRTPGEAELISTDFDHFVEAYASLNANSDTLGVLKALYFDRATAGLTEFINRHGLTPEMLAKAMGEYPDRYAMLPGFHAGLKSTRTSFSELMHRFGEVVPNAMYAPTYLLVGANRGIGQASQVGQLITVTRVADDPEKLRKLIVHELAHFQQAMAMGGQKYAQLYATPDNMLGLCLREGGAEFITALVLGDITQSTALTYIENDETGLKRKFVSDVEAQDKAFWLWESIDQQDHPKLLGYAMGYKICRAYYDRAGDKDLALQEVLRMEDPVSFTTASSYLDE